MEAKPERLQKVLAAAGIASRRKAEELIAAGRVSINGHVVTEPGTKADPRLDEIRVDGKLLRGPERHVYLATYKPKGYMTTVSDPEGRPTVMDLLKGVEERVFPVGRLDYMSEGLLLLTNDGDLMAQLTRAGSHVAKTYMVKVSGKPSEEAIDKLRNGIMLPPEPGLTGARGKRQPGVERRSFAVRTQPAAIQLAVDQENPWFEVTLTEGRNRQLRRMFEQIGHHIEKIKRIRYASLTLDLEPGEFRHLTPKEVNQLRKSLEIPFKPKPIKPKVFKAKQKRPGHELAERKPPIEAARFVRGRRGKPGAPGAPAFGAAVRKPGTEPRALPSADKPRRKPAGSARSAAGPEFGRSSSRRPFRAGEDRGPSRGFREARGPEFSRPEFSRQKRRDEGAPQQREGFAAKRRGGFSAKQRFPRKPDAEFGSGFEAPPESKFDSRRGPGPKRDFAAGRRFAKGPGKPVRGERRPAEESERGEFKPKSTRGGFERPGGDFKPGGKRFGRAGFKGPGPDKEGRGRFGRPSRGKTDRPSAPSRGSAPRRPRPRPEDQ